MDWRDEGALLAVRPHGESAAIVEVFTALHGRHAGVVHGGASRRMVPVLQPGAQLDLAWRARLDAHIGTFRVEPVRARAATILNDRTALAGLAAVCALAAFALPEREPQPALYAATTRLLDALAAGEPWPVAYVRWELLLLRTLGFGLDLASCALTGQTHDLAYVSPKTGRAVSRGAAGEWANRLLPLPAFFVAPTPPTSADPTSADPTSADPTSADLAAGLRLTGHFLAHRLAPALGDRPLPEQRARLMARLT